MNKFIPIHGFENVAKLKVTYMKLQFSLSSNIVTVNLELAYIVYHFANSKLYPLSLFLQFIGMHSSYCLSKQNLPKVCLGTLNLLKKFSIALGKIFK